MSNESLRDRIAYSLAQATSGGFQPGSPSAGWIKFAATHLIDEFELTVETVLSFDVIPEHLQGQFIDGAELSAWAEDKPKKSRIIGAWKWDNQ